MRGLRTLRPRPAWTLVDFLDALADTERRRAVRYGHLTGAQVFAKRRYGRERWDEEMYRIVEMLLGGKKAARMLVRFWWRRACCSRSYSHVRGAELRGTRRMEVHSESSGPATSNDRDFISRADSFRGTTQRDWAKESHSFVQVTRKSAVSWGSLGYCASSVRFQDRRCLGYFERRNGCTEMGIVNFKCQAAAPQDRRKRGVVIASAVTVTAAWARSPRRRAPYSARSSSPTLPCLCWRRQ